MEYDKNKMDEVVLALLYLTMFDDKLGRRAWKSHDWDALDRLHEKGYVSDPKSKAKSVVMTEEGAKRAKELFGKAFYERKPERASAVALATIQDAANLDGVGIGADKEESVLFSNTQPRLFSSLEISRRPRLAALIACCSFTGFTLVDPRVQSDPLRRFSPD